MRVALVIYDTLDIVSGGYRYDAKIFEILNKIGYKIGVFSFPNTTYYKGLFDNARTHLIRQLVDFKPHVVVQDHLIHPSVFLSNHSLRNQLQQPIVALVHHLRSSESHPSVCKALYACVERHFFTSIDACIYNSYTTKESVEQLAGMHIPGVVAYPGRDQAPRPQPSRNSGRPDGFEVLFVGNVIPRKGLDVLVEALSCCPYGSWNLTVVGDLDVNGEFARRIQSRVRELGLQHHVSFLGQVTNDHLNWLYARSDVLAVPSRYEGFGMVYLEALGFGTPVIASTAGAAKEFITDGKQGFLVAPDAPIQLAQRIQLLINRPNIASTMGREARAAWESHPTWMESATKIEQLLRSLMMTPSDQ